MGIPTGNHVNSSGITITAFKDLLRQQGVIEGSKKYEQAMSIFNQYASALSKESGTVLLDAEEQALARNDLEAMDINQDQKISRREFNQSDTARQLQSQGDNPVSYKGFKAFLNALNGTTENGEWYNDEVAVSENYNGNDFSLVRDNPEVRNPEVRNYRVGNSPSAVTNAPEGYQPPEPPQETSNPAEPAENYYTFKNMDDAYSNVYYYLLGRTEIDLGKNHELLNNLKVDLVNGSGLGFKGEIDGKEEITVTYHGKDYIMKRTAAGVITIERKDGENTVTLRDDILNESSTDTADHYHNRHGSANSGSRYDGTKFVINNTSARRQHVSTVQTFSSMLLNNDTGATLQIDKDFNAEAVINVINVAKTPDDAHKNEISLTDLLKYLNAAIQEAETTVEKLKGQNMGTRTYAAKVDMDMKDLANIGLVFKKFDTDNNGYLNKAELGNLIKALITGQKTMTSLAREQNTVQQPAKPEPVQTEPPIPDLAPFENNDGESAPVQQTQYGGRVSSPDRTRNVAGTNGDEQVQYMYDGGRRTLVEKVDGEYRTVLNANIAEYEDHGPLGAGRKDFIKIDGLRSNVRAEVVSGQLQGDMVIKIKDANGTVTYRKISYNAQTKTYKLGAPCDEQGNEPGKPQTATQLLQALGMDAENTEVPEGLIVKKKRGKNVYYLNGHKVPENVARAHVLAYNATNNPTYINGFSQADVPKSYGVRFGGKLFYGTVTVNADNTLTLTSEYSDKSKVTFKFNSLDDLRAGRVSEYTYKGKTVNYEYEGNPPKPKVLSEGQ